MGVARVGQTTVEPCFDPDRIVTRRVQIFRVSNCMTIIITSNKQIVYTISTNTQECVIDETPTSCTVPLVALVSNETKNDWGEYVGKYFYKRDADGNNPLMAKVQARRDAYKLDPLNVENHDKIMTLYEGSKEFYLKALSAATEAATKRGRPVDELDKYRALVWAISMWRDQAIMDEKEKFVEIMNIKEGNHRVGAMIIMLFNAAYEPRSGKIVCDTLDKDWFVQQVYNKDTEGRNIQEIQRAYANIDLRAEVLRLVRDRDSTLHRHFRVVLFVGKTEDVYDKAGVDMTYIQNLDISFSRVVSDDKKGSVEPTENIAIAANLRGILDLMENNAKKLQPGETPNFSANASVGGRLYVGHDRTYSSKITPARCSLFTGPKWNNMIKRPCPESAREYYASIQVGTVVKGKPLGKEDGRSNKKVPQPSGRTYNPPFPLDQDIMFGMLGVEGPGKRAGKKEPGTSNAETYSQRMIDEGQDSHPLTMSEHTKGVVVGLVAAAAHRAITGTGRHQWAQSTHRAECELAIQYIVDSQNFECDAAKWGGKIEGQCWDDRPWKEIFGNGQATKPDNVYIPFACMIGDMFVSCFSNIKADGMKKAREFVEMLATAHDDSADYKDKTMVENLGKLIGVNHNRPII